KSALARYIHACSPRAEGPLVDAPCAAMPPGRTELELFGAERHPDGDPAAVPAAAGFVEVAAAGTLVLDDVSQLEPAAQSALADALEHRAFRRVGSRTRIELETRIIAIGTVDLHAAVQGGAFREDLLKALGAVTIALPPVRDRAVDIPMLAQAFVREFGGP